MSDSVKAVRVSGYAMGSRFEVFLLGDDPDLLAEAGGAALAEVREAEQRLSHALPGSDLADLNARAAREAVRVSPLVLELLQRARRLTEDTDGAFDVTIGALLRCWGFFQGPGHLPGEGEIGPALECCGWRHVRVEPTEGTVRYAVPGLALHMGAIGKGHALDCAGRVLRERGVAAALLHGGGSSVVALGAPPGENGWRVGLRHPEDPARRLAAVLLRDAALATSAPLGQGFSEGGTRYGHILDPRTGWPASGTRSASVVAPTGEESDALATACGVLGVAGAARVCARRGVGAVLLPDGGGGAPLAVGESIRDGGVGAPAWCIEEWDGNERR